MNRKRILIGQSKYIHINNGEKIKIQWKADIDSWNNIIGSLNEGYVDFLETCRICDDQFILDWGGGEGNISHVLKNCRGFGNYKIINIDKDLSFLKKNPPDIIVVAGDGLRLPFKKDKFAGIHIRAAMHHIPNDLEICLHEIYRVLIDEGVVFIQEPLDGNLFSNFARKVFLTDLHDRQERPLNSRVLIQDVSQLFVIESIRYHFIFSYLTPHIISRLPFKSFWRKLAFQLFSIDNFFLKNIPLSRNYAEYIEILGRKRKTLDPSR